MVRTNYKSAFTLIELIFAIVVISITVISLPMMSQVTNNNIEKNLVQEGILIASTELIKTISGKWDENSKPDAYNFEYVMYIDNAEVVTANGNTTRPGNIRILYTPDNTLRPTTALNLGLDGVEDINSSDDIDDYITESINTTETAGSKEGYKFNYKKSISVTETASFGTVNDKNLKKATIFIKDKDDKNLVMLYMYVANTGSANSLSRTLLP